MRSFRARTVNDNMDDVPPSQATCCPARSSALAPRKPPTLAARCSPGGKFPRAAPRCSAEHVNSRGARRRKMGTLLGARRRAARQPARAIITLSSGARARARRSVGRAPEAIEFRRTNLENSRDTRDEPSRVPGAPGARDPRATPGAARVDESEPPAVRVRRHAVAARRVKRRLRQGRGEGQSSPQHIALPPAAPFLL